MIANSSESENHLTKNILERFRHDELALELKIAVFAAALNSYRNDSCLRPFPDIFEENSEKADAVKRMESMVSELKPIEDVIEKMGSYSIECQQMLDWVLNEKIFSVKTCAKNVMEDIHKVTGHSSYTVEPDFVFEIQYHTQASRKFDDMTKHYGTKYGFHGSRMDNFHSIVNNGLQVHMMKNGIFGEGVYLTEDLAVTMPYVKSGYLWQHSQLGERASCVAVCELLDHPGVKCTMETSEGGDRSTARDSQAGEVPQKYFVVTSSDLVRVKYLLLFTDKHNERRTKRLTSQSWFCFRYPVLTILIAYALLLLAISLCNNRTLLVTWKRFWRAPKGRL